MSSARGDLLRGPVGDEPPVGEQEEPVGVLGGERDVVHRRDHRQLALLAQRRDQLERLLLAAEVERGRRLVEQEQGRVLRERPAEHGALLLAARERLQAPLRERAEVEAGERPARRLQVGRPLVAERPEVGRPAEQDVLVDAHPGRQERRLGDEREPAGDLAAAERGDLDRRRG